MNKINNKTKTSWFIYQHVYFIVPYSNALIIYFSENLLVQIEYSLNIFAIGLFSFLNWTYATHKHRLVEESLAITTKSNNLILFITNIRSKTIYPELIQTGLL